MTTEQKVVVATVDVGRPVNIKDGVMLAQEGTMTDEDIREMLGEEAPRAGYRRGTKAAGQIMDALGDVITPGPEDAIGVVGKAKDLKKVGEAVGRSLDELSDLRKASDAGKTPVVEGPSPKIHSGKQGKHVAGHNNYTPDRSILTADPSELGRRAGTGQQVGNIEVGLPGSKERVDFGEGIGTYVDSDGNGFPTSVGIIHYAKDGIHIVPARP